MLRTHHSFKSTESWELLFISCTCKSFLRRRSWVAWTSSGFCFLFSRDSELFYEGPLHRKLIIFCARSSQTRSSSKAHNSMSTCLYLTNHSSNPPFAGNGTSWSALYARRLSLSHCLRQQVSFNTCSSKSIINRLGIAWLIKEVLSYKSIRNRFLQPRWCQQCLSKLSIQEPGTWNGSKSSSCGGSG